MILDGGNRLAAAEELGIKEREPQLMVSMLIRSLRQGPG